MLLGDNDRDGITPSRSPSASQDNIDEEASEGETDEQEIGAYNFTDTSLMVRF